MFINASVRSLCRPEVEAFYEARTCSLQYVVSDPQTGVCAIIDPVLDYDARSGVAATRSADAILDFVRAQELRVEWILDTHPHADHLSAAAYLKSKTGAKMAIGEKIVAIQKLWKDIYNLPDTFPCDGSQWNRLFADAECFWLGDLTIEVMLSPGHTMASVTYVVGDAAFIHDTLFMPDGGTARADFPGGDARALWRSIQRILSFPGQTRLFTGHDYRPGGRAPAWESTIPRQKAENVHLRMSPCEQAFVALREARDRDLPMPDLILQAMQVNIAGGCLPDPEANGRRYLKIPIEGLESSAWTECSHA